jgi:hypothetical protein
MGSKRALLVAVALSVTVLVAASCNGDDDGAATGTASPTGTSSPTATETPTATSTMAGAIPTATATVTVTSTATPSQTATAATEVPLVLQLSKHPESDDDPTVVFGVERVSPDSGVARFAIKELLQGPTAEEESGGLFSTWTSFGYGTDSDCGDDGFELALKNGVLTVRFCVTVVLLGSVADAQAATVMTETLTQFATIDHLVILNRENHCMFDLSGEDLCLEG